MRNVVGAFALFLIVGFGIPNTIKSGGSMTPTYPPGTVSLLDRITPLLGYSRGDVVTGYQSGRLVTKRVIGLPGDLVEIIDGTLYVNSAAVAGDGTIRASKLTCEKDGACRVRVRFPIVGDNELFLVGDNPNGSSDSRHAGAIDREQVIGKNWITLYRPPAQQP